MDKLYIGEANLELASAIKEEGDFAEYKNLTGNAPNLWEMIPEPDGEGCFCDYEKLSNHGIIPEPWIFFKNK